MLLKETYPIDLPTSTTPIRVFITEPSLPSHPTARFPAVIVWSEIYQVTGPVARFASQIAAHGYIVACPSVYHEFEGPEPLAYDVKGTDRGNELKVKKELRAYDEDARVVVDWLGGLERCTGRIGTTGMCLGGHLAFRTAFDKRVTAAVCFFPTDIHSSTLGTIPAGDTVTKDSLTLVRSGALSHAELLILLGKQDTHIPRAGRDLIRATLEDANVVVTWCEFHHAQHAYIRDTSSKGRYDAVLTGLCFQQMLEVFYRTLVIDLGGGERVAAKAPVHVC
ncbi:dienelactone hydrolase [Fimicolochytrium jonesii]|uniref:dienelactone hydrolase n=1 Tax=Fimicolochytrium jonesii TaxID=1396493 RepID=UPI0022FEB22B|nr:dienelactone hydrolase [Fimicolochytrium jonesii]KAI8820815.1 dienelactone hydrolase [Fimicolochytrium jonesii]